MQNACISVSSCLPSHTIALRTTPFLPVNVKFTEIVMNIMYYLLHLLFKKEESRKNNTENFNDNNSKTIKQKLQQQQENLYPRRKCMLKGFFKGRTIISKSYFFLNAQLLTKKYDKTVKRDLFLM